MDRKCAICRRAMQKLFLKGERCFSPKCSMVRRPYVPGIFGRIRKKARKTRSDYGVQFQEKQNFKNIYGLKEKQFKRYIKDSLSIDDIIKQLETRLDNVIFRLGMASSRSQAKQFISHGHFLVNKKKVDTSSYSVKPGDTVGLKIKSQKLPPFTNLATILKKHEIPSWLTFDLKKLEGKINSFPTPEDVGSPFDLRVVVEFYSR